MKTTEDLVQKLIDIYGIVDEGDIVTEDDLEMAEAVWPEDVLR